VRQVEDVEEAERLRDPSHVRNYSEAEWRDFAAAGRLDQRGVGPRCPAITSGESVVEVPQHLSFVQRNVLTAATRVGPAVELGVSEVIGDLSGRGAEAS